MTPDQRKHQILSILNKHPFAAPWWLRGPHSQTLWPAFFRASRPPAWIEVRIDTDDADVLSLYVGIRDAETPIVLLLHGLEGSPRSSYLANLAKAIAEMRWGVAALQFRGCGGEMNRARRLYHSGDTSDLSRAIEWLRKRWPARRVYLCGFSLGGNVLAKWLGEIGSAAAASVTAAAAIGLPFDLAVSAAQLDRALDGRYARYFVRSLVRKAIAKERQFPGCLDVERIKSCSGIVEFDELATAPLHGFAGAADYYAKSSCGQFLQAIRVPTLLIASADDPYSPPSTLPRRLCEESPWLIPQFTHTGGHVGFVMGATPLHARYWAEEQVLRYFSAMESAEQS